MGWLRLHSRKTLEAKLQLVFNQWGSGQTGCTLAGVPGWLASLGPPEPRGSFDREGYAFRPDVLWPEHVAELKSAEKFEPIALAEALHHAQCLSMARHVPVTPILITSYNGWLRRALEFLFTRGIQRHHIRYVEVGHLALARGQEHFMWFDEPYAPWEPAPVSSLPACIGEMTRFGTWYYVAETRSWHALRDRQDARPVIPEGPVQIVTRIEGLSPRYLFWQGAYDEVGDSYLLDEASQGDAPPPTSIFDE
jgi:hypothetical protein